MAAWQLPPLILHPFNGGGSTTELVEGSRASLTLQGLLQTDGSTRDVDEYELERRVLVGRYQEIRMLIFLGKDISRWLQQCVDFMDRSGDPSTQPGSGSTKMSEQSFASLVVESPPANVRLKLEKWGVTDRRAVFSRAIGVNTLFSAPPPIESLSPVFLKHYHRFADHAYICFQHLKPFQALDAKQFEFEIYASEEYARLLSEQWEKV
jgi:hypothetical protein